MNFKSAKYITAEARVLGFAKHRAAYYAGPFVRARALTPGGLFTNYEDCFVRTRSAKTNLGRMPKKDEMKGILLLLASCASSYMTGCNVVADGGWAV